MSALKVTRLWLAIVMLVLSAAIGFSWALPGQWSATASAAPLQARSLAVASTPDPETVLVALAHGYDRANQLLSVHVVGLGSTAAEEGSSASEQAASKVPDEWGPGQPARSGGGWRWIPNKGDYVSVDPGNPDSDDPLQQVDHVHVTSNGQVVADHLPLSEWLQWGSWNQP